ncbi:MAG: Ig-like domain-containing protein [bacterium]|nr:Ig-like domain-containing protein [bacterium]
MDSLPARIVFTTRREPPTILSTLPAAGSDPVPQSQPVIIIFSEPMDTSSVILTTSPDIGNYTVTWNQEGTEVTYSHSGFAEKTVYMLEVAGQDPAGNDLVPGQAPNPWSFKTGGANPAIIAVTPLPGFNRVTLDQPVFVVFSEPMDTPSVILQVTPDPGGWEAEWNESGNAVTYAHNPFISGTAYMTYIEGHDLAGLGLVPGETPNPWAFMTEDTPPVVTAVTPPPGSIDVPLDQTVVVTFSEQIATGTLTFGILPDPGNWTVTWNDGINTEAALSHSPFQEGTTYYFEVTGGMDPGGNILTNIPYPVTFTTLTLEKPPVVVSTVPDTGTVDVAFDQPIIITFSRPMNKSSLRTTSTPDPGGWTAAWNEYDTRATFSHAGFAESTAYTFRITQATSQNGLDLDPRPYPINFTTLGEPPVVVSTTPEAGAADLTAGQPVIIIFSKPMNKASVKIASTPDPGGWTVAWNDADTQAAFSHADFAGCTAYTFRITQAKGQNDLDLASLPFSLTFTTQCDTVPPLVTGITPKPGAAGVSTTQPVIITFSEEIKTVSFSYVDTLPGGWTVNWNETKTQVILNHTPFNESTTYGFKITGGTDLAGNSLPNLPYSWSFRTVEPVIPPVPPVITALIPGPDAAQVALDQPVVVTFSKPMNTTSFVFSDTLPGGWWTSWNQAGTQVTIYHNTFEYSTTYSFKITGGTDPAGNSLPNLPYPWSFRTVDPVIPPVPPVITALIPGPEAAQVALDQPVVVTFSKPMNTTSFVFSDTLPGGWWTSWNQAGTQVTIYHNTFEHSTTYSFKITGGTDLEGNSLSGLPYLWKFSTLEAPTVVSTNPETGTGNVALQQPVIITFSQPMNPTGLQFDVTPDPGPGNWTVAWNESASQAMFSHAGFAASTAYTFRITQARGQNNLDLDTLPYPFTFTTQCETAPPLITGITPKPGATGVSPAQPVIITFSEEMDTDSFFYECTLPGGGIFPGGWTESWNETETQVVLDHHIPFEQSTTYGFKITGGTDLCGNPLPNLPYSWTFTTVVEPPVITEVGPKDGATGVGLTQPVVVTFSKPMNTDSITYSDTLPGGWTVNWNEAKTQAAFSHSNVFRQLTTYGFEITGGTDPAGNKIINLPYTWSFTTLDISPTIVAVSPKPNAVRVPLEEPVIVVFSEPMNTGSVDYTDTLPYSWTVSWNEAETQATFSHSNPFEEMTVYGFEITGGEDQTGSDLPGVPYSWDFISTGINPFITAVSPEPDAVGVALDQPVVVTFSQRMNPDSLKWTEWTEWTVEWNEAETEVTFYHSNLFAESTRYSFEITGGEDSFGLKIVNIPYLWSFTTVGIPPQITEVTPDSGAVKVKLDQPIVVTFSERMNTDSVVTYADTLPEGWSVSWNEAGTEATFFHSNPFEESTAYSFEITGGTDTAGNTLLDLPFTWSFTTVVLPVITGVTPGHDTTGVSLTQPVIVTFSRPMDTGSFAFADTLPGGWETSWNEADTQVTIFHNSFQDATIYGFEITGGQDKAGNELTGLPYVWSFTTVIPPVITGISPERDATGVGLDQPVIVTFSKPMDTNSFSFSDTLLGDWWPSWNEADTQATIYHYPFKDATTYCVEITAGTDKDGNSLPNLPYDWCFTTVGLPVITSVSPNHGDTEVGLDQPVIVTFSNPMNTDSFAFADTLPGGWWPGWNEADTQVTIYHNSFQDSTTYAFEITGGQDKAGNELTGLPYTWSFTTVAIEPPPVITGVSPERNAAGVGLTQPVIITFSKPMDTGSFDFADTLPGGWGTPIWNQTNTQATIYHNSFQDSTTYAFEITGGRDKAGNELTGLPYAWSFTTKALSAPTAAIVVEPPAVTTTRIIQISLTASENLISIPALTYTPAGGDTVEIPLTGSGSNWAGSAYIESYTPSGEAVFAFSGTGQSGVEGHTITSGETFEIDLTISSSQGGKVTNSDSSSVTVLPGAFSEDVDITITQTDPHLINEANQNIDPGFSIPEGYDLARTFTVVEEATGDTVTQSNLPLTITLAYSDNDGDGYLDGTDIREEDLRLFRLNEAEQRWEELTEAIPNASDNELSVETDEPGIYTILAKEVDEIPPAITAVSPEDSATQVALNQSVIVAFSERMDTGGSLICNIKPTAGGLTVTWNKAETEATVAHDPFTNSTTYQFSVTGGRDLAGNDLAAAKSWSFTTVGITGVQVHPYPNPCKANEVRITNLPVDSHPKVYIFDAAGELVRTLDENSQEIVERSDLGVKEAVWDITNDNGTKASYGIYIYLVESDKGSWRGKIAVIR